MKTLVFGATGITGSLLIKLLLQHPHVSSVTALSTSNAGKMINEYEFPNAKNLLEKLSHKHYVSKQELDSQYDVVFSALPHGISSSFYHELIPNLSSPTTNSNPIYIDLSADFRYSSLELFSQAYPNTDTAHSAAHAKAVHKSVYGLSELQRNKIAQASLIACPGCYPTSILLPIVPLLRYCTPTSTITITSISGISGAGNKPSLNSLYVSRAESLCPYSPGSSHRHYSEIAHHIKEIAHAETSFFFTPQLAPLAQGMLSCIHIPLENSDIARAEEAIISQYIDETFVTVFPSREPFQINSQLVRNTNHAHIALHKETNMLIIFCVIDNLWKGAVGQAIQNFNIRFDFPEHTGLF